MNILMTIFFGFLAFVSLTMTAAIREKAPKTVVVDQNGILTELNKERREYAKKRRITSMYKLIWDENLATKAKNRDFSGHKISYRTARIDGNQAVADHAKFWGDHYLSDDNLEELMKDHNNFHVNGMEQLVPHQKKVGCAPFFYSQHVTGFKGEFMYHTLCFLGPEGTGNSWNYPRGEPGSKCTKGYQNENGLCAPIVKNAAKLVLDAEDPANQSNGMSYGTSVIDISITFIILWISTLI